MISRPSWALIVRIMSDQRAADVEHLMRMFPKLDTSVIESTYDRHNRDVEKCVPVLLNMITASSSSSR